jgi:hypothetical protein
MESMVGGYSPGLRGSAAKAAPAITVMARHVAAKIFIVSPLIVYGECAGFPKRRQLVTSGQPAPHCTAN